MKNIVVTAALLASALVPAVASASDVHSHCAQVGAINSSPNHLEFFCMGSSGSVRYVYNSTDNAQVSRFLAMLLTAQVNRQALTVQHLPQNASGLFPVLSLWIQPLP
jgi:hypothetical protein